MCETCHEESLTASLIAFYTIYSLLRDQKEHIKISVIQVTSNIILII